jgi:siroheme synthase
VVSGHAEAAYRPILGSIEPNCVTVVVLMGLASRAAVAALLLERGWPKETPAAILLAASTPESFAWTGLLAELGAAELPEDRCEAPGTLVIGEVVSLAESIAHVPHTVHTSVAAGHGSS